MRILSLFVAILGLQAACMVSGSGVVLAASRLTERSALIFVDSFPANVHGIILDRTVLKVSTAETNSTVRVWALASDPHNDPLIYEYAVSAGRIVGATRKRVMGQNLVSYSVDRKGSDVIWDLGGVGPGEYTITAGVDDGCGICGRTATQTLTILSTEVERAESPEPCSPDVKIVPSRDFTRKNETIEFLLVSNSRYERLPRIIWSASGGQVLGGQGTPMVNVRVDKDAKKTMSVTAQRDNSESSGSCKLEAGFIVQIKKR